jgi:signal transduction histidine kinase
VAEQDGRSWPAHKITELLTGRRGRRNVALLTIVGVAYTTLCTWPLWVRAPWYAVVPVLLCATFCGILLVLNDEVGRGRGGATSLLLVIAGFLWPLNFVYEWDGAPATYASMCGSTAFWCVSCWASLMYPRQRLERTERIFLVLVMAGLGLPDVYLIGTGKRYEDIPDFGILVCVVGALFPFVVAARYRRYRGVQRRTLTPVIIASTAVALAGGIGWFVLISHGIYTALADQAVIDRTLCVQGVVLLVFVPAGFFVGGLHRRFIQAAVAETLARLPPAATPEELRDALRGALRDDRLDVLYWSVEQDAYVDARGRVVTPPAALHTASVISLRTGNRNPLALLVVDRQLDGETVLFGDTVSAPREPLVKAWLQARDRAYQQQRRMLQRRLEEERWNERRRLGRDLHDGVQQHLYALGTCLAVAREQTHGHPAGATIDNACRQLAELLPLFRTIVHDLAPPELAQYGLGPAIHALIERQPIPIEAHISRERVPVEIEHMAYLIVCEALTNILKHADASRVYLQTDVCDDDLVVTVSDDGNGAADLTRGTGLAGLCDRVQSIGGRLELDSPPMSGTTIRVRIPCG